MKLKGRRFERGKRKQYSKLLSEINLHGAFETGGGDDGIAA
jgi:hypothetical protein